MATPPQVINVSLVAKKFVNSIVPGQAATSEQPTYNDIDGLPSQSGNSGKILQTDGSVLSFVAPPISAVWGNIVGTITNQTDLINYLEANYLQLTDFGTEFDADFAAKDTDDLAEGPTNLYFTDARAKAASVSDVAYNATTWDGVIDVAPSKNAVRDKFVTIDSDIAGKEPVISAGTTLQYWRGDKTFQTLDTGVVPENGNLYYTSTRFNTAFAAKSTTDLSEGTNLYYTDARAKAAAVSDAAYNATSWNGVTNIAPSKNAIRDKIEDIVNRVASENALDIDTTGEFFPSPYQFISNKNLEFNGVVYGMPGKWVDSFSHVGLQDTSNPVGVETIVFNDLVGALGFTAVNNSLLTSISSDSLKYINSLTLTNNGALTTLDFPNLIYLSISSMSGNTLLTTFDFPTVKIGGLFNISGSSFTSIDLSAMVACSTFSPSGLTTLTSLDISALEFCSGNFGPSGCTSLTTFSAPALVYVGAGFTISGNTGLTSVSLPLLKQVVSGINFSSQNSVTTLSFPALESTTGISIAIMTGLTTISMPALVCATSNITASSGLGNVANVTLGAVGTTKKINGSITFTNQKLTQASVDQILAVIASLNGTNGTTSWGSGKVLQLNGGTNATPSATGLADKAIIQARGATVTTN